ncbi:MAG: hypothetical protein AB7F28_07005 [Candidatus Margulisiibacteriota bacterium]
MIQTLLLCLLVATMLTILADLKRRNVSWTIIAIVLLGVFFLPIVAIPLYLVLRNASFIRMSNPMGSKETLPNPVLCSKCGHDNPAGATTCGSCNNRLHV